MMNLKWSPLFSRLGLSCTPSSKNPVELPKPSRELPEMSMLFRCDTQKVAKDILQLDERHAVHIIRYPTKQGFLPNHFEMRNNNELDVVKTSR